MNIKNIKIRVPTPEISESVQRKLFEMGALWYVCQATKVCNQSHPYLYIDSNSDITYGTSEYEFVLHSNKEIKYQEILSSITTSFSKQDLVPGLHILETKSGERYLYLEKGILVVIGGDSFVGWTTLDSFDDNFKKTYPSVVMDDHVTKIYEIEIVKGGFILNDKRFLKLVWSKAKRMTKDEIEKQLGFEIEIIE